jgi:alanine dehydrogenase
VALYIDHDTVTRTLTWRECIDLLEAMCRHEADGQTFVSPKFNTDFRGGNMRILFAADGVAGYGATKAYHTIEKVGTRYLVSLIDLRSGSLLALVDGRQITDFRTGAASGVVARRVPFNRAVTVGIIGSGHQARAQLECLATAYEIERVSVYSPTPANRERFAAELGAKLDLKVIAVPTAEEAVRGHDVVAAAGKVRSKTPVLMAEWLDNCRLLCAVGNTRAQFMEIDPRCFDRARLTVVDSLHAWNEAGELIAASAAVPPEARSTLAAITKDHSAIPRDGLVVFKSVGTALQDLALAGRCYELLRGQPGTPDLPDLCC